jgi:hypothetical protein
MLGRRSRSWVRGIFLSAILIACLPSDAVTASSVPMPAMPAKAPAEAQQITSLEGSTQPLEQYFNQTRNQTRFLALLSPT